MQVLARHLNFQNKVPAVLARTALSLLRRSIKEYQSNGGEDKLGKRKLLYLTLVNLSSSQLKLQSKGLQIHWPGQKALSQKLTLTVNLVKYRTMTSLATKHSTSTTIEPHLTYRRHRKCSDKLSTPTILYKSVQKNWKSTKTTRKLFSWGPRAT